MNALRTNVRDVPGLGAQTIFSVYRFSVLGDWALITVDPRNRDGSPTSRYDSHIEESGCDHEIIALLQRGNSGWRVVERAVGPCDSALEIWLSQHGVSERILDKWGGMENWLGPR